MKIIGIGNAIVDVICKINDQYLIDNELTKSTMKLVDENEFKKLLSTLKIEETVSGGSVANSMVGLSQLGNDVGFIGKINNDNNPITRNNFKAEFLDILFSVLLEKISLKNMDKAKEDKMIIDKDANTSNRTNAELI